MSNTNKRCKPDWKDAPLWAKWRAQDQDGRWFWYMKKPIKQLDTWILNEGEYALANTHVTGWENTLEKRPKEVK